MLFSSKWVFCCVCVVASFSVWGRQTQPEQADSLKKVIARLPDGEAKVKAYVTLIHLCNTFDRPLGLQQEASALALTKRLGNPVWDADIKSELGRVYWRDGQFAKARKFHEEAISVYVKADDKPKIALATRYLAQDYADSGFYPEALKYLFDALARYEALNDKRNQAYVHNLFAWVYGKQGNYVEASRSSFRDMALFEELGDKDNVARSAADAAEYYLHLGNYEEALKAYTKAEASYQASGDRINLGYLQNSRARVYRLKGVMDSALHFYEAGYVLGLELNDVNVMGQAEIGMAEIYEGQGDLQAALLHATEAATLYQRVGNRLDMARTYCKLGNYERMRGDLASAEAWFAKAYFLARELSSRNLLAEYYQGTSLLDSARGRWRDAFRNYKDYVASRDSMLGEDNIRKMVQLQMQYEFDRREAAMQAEQAERNLRQRRQFIFMVIIVGLVVTLAIVLYRNQRKENFINQQLKAQSAHLEEENREKTSILNIVSHDLKAPFNKIQGLLQLLRNSPEMPESEKAQYFDFIQSSIDQGNYLIGKLLESQAAATDRSSASNEQVHLHSFLDQFAATTRLQLAKKSQQIRMSLPAQALYLPIDPQRLLQVLDNLVSNASKFSARGSQINLSLWQQGQSVYFSVRDEGPGISVEDQRKMFRRFQKLSAHPTGGEGSVGLGLSIVKSIIEKWQGSLEVRSELGKGTEFIFSVPLQLV